MIIEQPPLLYRWLFRRAWWRLPRLDKTVYLTFDDGPIPVSTLWLLDVLDAYAVKACFFCVGDNVRKYPHLYSQILERGHQVGNHTYNHLQGLRCRTRRYVRNVVHADRYIDSPYFRPPHGHLRMKQDAILSNKYQMVMWDVVTRDYYNKFTADDVVNIVERYTRNGSIIVFHDSLKSINTLRDALPRCIEWLLSEGYTISLLPPPGFSKGNDNR